jgi:hypothetical protein
MFISGLFTIDKIWNHLRCPSADKWINVFIYIMEYYSAIGRMKFCHLQQNEEGFILTERQIPQFSLIYHSCCLFKEINIVEV